MTRSALESYNNTNITTNNNEEITGQIHNTMNQYLITNCLNKDDDLALYSLFDYDSSRSYIIGMGVFYSGNVYRCTNNTTGVFNPSHWSSVTLVKDEFSFTPATAGSVMTLVSGATYRRTHSLSTNTPKVIVVRPNGEFFNNADLNLKVIDVNTIELNFGWEVEAGTTYVLIEK